MRRLNWMAWLFSGCLSALAQPTVTPTTVPTFTYMVNSGAFPAAQVVKVTQPAASTLPIVVVNTQIPPAATCLSSPSSCGWLSVSPSQGNTPLTLSVSVNPTGLSPGNYTGSFVVDTLPSSGKQAVTVAVTLQVTNAAPKIVVAPALSSLNNWTASVPTGSLGTLGFNYTTGADQSTLVPSELDVSSTGDIIPFNVTVANSKSGSSGSGTTAVWLRVSSTSPIQGYGVATSGSAFGGSLVPIYVEPDYTTLLGLGIGQYQATVTITPVTSNTKQNTPIIVTVSLVVSAGAPTFTSVFPSSLGPAQPTDPVFTLYGTNFTANTSVYLDVFLGLPNQISYQITTDRITLISAQILTAKVPTADLPVAPSGTTYPYPCQFRIANGGFPQVQQGFSISNPSSPSITTIVNAASYQPMSTFAGAAPDVTPKYPSAISPRGVISIFGQNLGPAVPFEAATVPCATGNCYPTKVTPTTLGSATIQVSFTYYDPTYSPAKFATINAPILMVSTNQINLIVPWEVANIFQQTTKPYTATVKVLSNAFASNIITVAVLPEDPGIFTFGGLGQGQGAIINYDASGASTINSATNKEPRGDVIAIFATGLGDLSQLSDGSIIPDGALTQSSVATTLASSAGVQVFIGGQPAVVQWAGTSPGAVAGLVQINAVVPPTAGTGTVPITLSITDVNNPLAIRNAQTGVTLGVK